MERHQLRPSSLGGSSGPRPWSPRRWRAVLIRAPSFQSARSDFEAEQSASGIGPKPLAPRVCSKCVAEFACSVLDVSGPHRRRPDESPIGQDREIQAVRPDSHCLREDITRIRLGVRPPRHEAADIRIRCEGMHIVVICGSEAPENHLLAARQNVAPRHDRDLMCTPISDWPRSRLHSSPLTPAHTRRPILLLCSTFHISTPRKYDHGFC